MSLRENDVREIAGIIGLNEVEAEPVAPMSVEDLTNAIKQLERRMEALERQRTAGGRVETTQRVPAAPASAAPTNGSTERVFTPEMTRTIQEAVATVRRTGRSRATPSILAAMNAALGYDLKQTSYNGYGNATAFFEAAKQKGIIKFGPTLGPNPTIFLTEEESD
jgi:hypothetical protein